LSSPPLPPGLERYPELDSWIRIEADGTVTLFTGKVELGQGLRTAIARIGAEELDVGLERIRVVTADTSRTPNELYTAGSGSMEQSGRVLRQATAEARRHLLELAAEELGAHVDGLEVEDGTVSVAGASDGRSTTYWELLGGKEFQQSVSGTVPPKPPERYRILGRPGPGIDLPSKVTGAPCFVHDLSLPGMVYGRVVRPPSPGARLVSVDEEETRAMPGVLTVVRDGSFLAVVAEREEQAVRAREALRDASRWAEEPTLPPPSEIHQRLVEGVTQSLRVIEGVPQEGPVEPMQTPAGAASTLEATYTKPYHMHASLGPSAAAAHYTEQKLTIWTHTQGLFLTRLAIAQALGMEPDDIHAIHVEGAGCYGHNGADDAAFDAALIALAVPGRPVLLQWMREDEHAWEPYSPAMIVKLRGSLDAGGGVVDWNHDVYSNSHIARPLPYGERSAFLAAWHRAKPMAPPRPRPSLGAHAGIHRNADPLYAFARRRVVKHFVEEAPLRVSSTRGLGAYANVFAIESFMDELAGAAGVDAIEFRLRHLEDERARAVLEAAARKSGWGGARGAGFGRGIAFSRYENSKSYAAVVIELRADRESGAIQLERAVITADAGQIIDPDGLANQLEGGLVQAASWTLKEQVTFDRTRVTSVDWESYPILTFPEVPSIETVLLNQPGEPWLGAGEATQGPTPAAIANALYDALGVRLRDVPFTPDRVLGALRSTGEARV
jgi:CO/xanthine dehydrogenase Mo-binding subunit